MDGWVVRSGGKQSCPADLVIITDRRVSQSNHSSSKQLLPLMAPFVLHLVLTCSPFLSLDLWSRATESLPSWPVISAQDNDASWPDCSLNVIFTDLTAFSLFTFFQSFWGKKQQEMNIDRPTNGLWSLWSNNLNFSWKHVVSIWNSFIHRHSTLSPGQSEGGSGA